MNYHQEIAATIWNQLRTLGMVQLMCWGVSQRAAGKDLGILLNPETGEVFTEKNVLGYLRLTCTRVIARKVYVYIALMGNDTYTVIIVKAKNLGFNEIIHRQEQVYFDELVGVIDGVIETRTIKPNQI